MGGFDGFSIGIIVDIPRYKNGRNPETKNDMSDMYLNSCRMIGDLLDLPLHFLVEGET